MPVERAAIQLVVELYRDRADEIARQYQAGNFRTLKHLMHRAALIAQATGAAGIIRAGHVETAIRHGELTVPEAGALDQQTHIREVFQNALEERNVAVRPGFGLDDLKEWSNQKPIEAAYGFLRCNLIPRAPGGKRGKYYELKEIETALAKGYGRGSWINSTLKPEHVVEAAHTYFGLDRGSFAGDKVNDIVKKVQKAGSS